MIQKDKCRQCGKAGKPSQVARHLVCVPSEGEFTVVPNKYWVVYDCKKCKGQYRGVGMKPSVFEKFLKKYKLKEEDLK